MQWIIGILSLKGVVFRGGDDVCARAWPYAGYVFLILASFVASTVLEICLIKEGCKGMPLLSTRPFVSTALAGESSALQSLVPTHLTGTGSLFEDQKRKKVAQLLLINLLVALFMAGVNAWGTWMMFHHGALCKGTAFEWRRHALNSLVWTTWAMLAIFALFIIVPLQLMRSSETSSPSSWRFRCMVLACCCCKSRCACPPPFAPSAIPSFHRLPLHLWLMLLIRALFRHDRCQARASTTNHVVIHTS